MSGHTLRRKTLSCKALKAISNYKIYESPQMNEQEASAFTKQLLSECKLNSNSFVLIEPNPNDKLSTGYKVCIKTDLDNECKLQIKKITKNHDLAVIIEKSQIVIYKPKPNQLSI
jgi:hypothetical protein